LCGFSAAAAYAARPSALARKMLPRGGPVSAPPPSFYAPAPAPQQHRHLQSCAPGRCCPTAAAAAYQQQQQAAATLRMAAANAAAAAAAAAPVPWNVESVYSSADVFELARPLDLDFTSAPSRSIWSNTPASSSSQEADGSATSGYSSGSSERGSGAGSPRAADASATGASPRSPDASAFATPAQPSLVFDFSRNVQDSSLDAACRQIQEQLNLNP
ncbi:hypothetical protein PENTCL1PPCAC_3525, partial [Pristionchus entomophagus]